MDQRDRYIDQLSQLMDIRVVTDDHNQVNIFTNSGVQLVGVARRATVVQRPGHGDGGDAMERRSDQEQRSARSCSVSPNGTTST